MPRPRREPSPDDRQVALPLAKAPARRAAPTPERSRRRSRIATRARWASRELAMITLRLALPRAVLERLRGRAIREGRKVEAIIQEILRGAAK